MVGTNSWRAPLVAALCIGYFVQMVHGEMFTALVEMEELLVTEAVLIDKLESYILEQDTKLAFLRQRVHEYQKEHNEASSDISGYLSNPINAFSLTKRLTSDWDSIEIVMSNESSEKENVTNYKDILKFPSTEDLNGAAVALMRLQDTYKLDTASIAKGQLNGVQYSSEMSANDCFEIGRQSYNNRDYYHTVLWMNEALERLGNSNQTTIATNKSDILEYLSISNYYEGNLMLAINMTNELLELVPNHTRVIGNKAYYLEELYKKELENPFHTEEKLEPSSEASANTDPEPLTIYQKYEKICRGEVSPSPAQLAKLRCRYVTENSAFLKIAPLKVEEASLKPYIVVFHEVLYDNEIELVKDMAKPRFKRATVQNAVTGELEYANYRISKSGWIEDWEHKTINDISRRVEDMTGLSMFTAEQLQVVNYGIGGHYETHYDFARKEEVKSFDRLNTGNRIATVLFYMSDVAQGGATVFPSIDVALKPKKGTAAFWYNLHASGVGDLLTIHAACPVLSGSKWVCNKWIHEKDQEFRRPCNLTPDHPPEDE